ncbi:MAG: Maf family nucleotide pyrophosphatase [Betaproteobacteria bacterium]|jgi:septum formation protein|nr:Maf family nucleotide pyrophosphatase [Betaproteobacteria bacterium]
MNDPRPTHRSSRRTTRQLVLASTSPYRRKLLERLRVPFEVVAPGVDETPLPDETPEALTLRLAIAKARSAGRAHPDALVIGSDQVASLDGAALSKPEVHDRAVAQLRQMRGRRVEFLTALAVHCEATAKTVARTVRYAVEFRDFSDRQLEDYLRAEQPYDCAGSAKADGLGIALIRRMEGDDPNALIGLPLIALVELLAEHGFDIL